MLELDEAKVIVVAGGDLAGGIASGSVIVASNPVGLGIIGLLLAPIALGYAVNSHC